MTGNEIRKKFLDYFAERGHRVVRSSSLVPVNDPTLLFTNAGMNQFKDVFLGLEHRDYTRAVSSQKCVRAGGKHNDLENVGRTRRHHTFFEMLGNFSFGDYFKKEAIEYAWELVTKEYGLPVEKLFFTFFEGGLGVPKDEEAQQLWLRVGAPAERVRSGGIADNFWAMGETGPCGPCSEIHYDLGPGASDEGHADCPFPCECGRYVEIWNLVFMQFNRDASGALSPLPRPCVDTGMGLERVAAVIQGKLSNFETDLLWPLVEEAAELTGTDYGEKHDADVSLRILADHSRAATFLISDGVLPANEGRGYVLRKILRRAIRHGGLMGMKEPFLYRMTGKVAELMSDAYPELLESTQRVAAVVKSEEQRFAHTMSIALQEFENVAAGVLGTTPCQYPDFQMGDREGPGSRTLLPGDKLFRLYDTFGMPLDWIKETADQRAFMVDEAGFDAEMQRQRERARASWKGVAKEALSPAYAEVLKKGRTAFEGYQETTSHDCTVLALLREGQLVEEVPPGTKAELVLDHTPFYAEAGGQVGDTGTLVREESHEVAAVVEDTYSPVSGLIAHRIVSRTPVRVGDRLTAVVFGEKRRATMRNHTATHLLHAALRQVLGPHVKQAGSVVEPDRLRFDFSHFAPVGHDEVEEIERLVNAEILENTAVQTEVLELDQALETGAMAFFGEKYPDRVRVVSVPDFSKELCGGTHVSRTGDIGLLKITHEGSIAAGVRRVEAVTGVTALGQFQAASNLIRELSGILKSETSDLTEKTEKLVEAHRELEKQIESLRLKAAQAQLADVESRVRSVKDVKVLSIRLDALDRSQMRTLADQLRQQLKSGVVVLGTVADGKVALIAALTPDLTKRLHAGKIAKQIAEKLGGTGGGRPDLAEAGGKNTAALDAVLNEVYEMIGAML
ncbi:MAG: alanine--tRNA ligase [Acidobacteria bacterium]|nr:alanine--tRNA ligase [Acidobacteriota bacterium]